MKPTFRDWVEAGGTERRSKRLRRVRSADGCPRRGGHLMGFPCGRCDRAEAVDAERARRESDDRGRRAEAVRILAYVAAERRWDREHAADDERHPLGPWARPMIARAAWCREHAVEVLP